MKTETTWIECNGARLYGELHIPDAVPAPAMLICHGMSRQGLHALKIYRQLSQTACKSGFTVFLFDFRGVGKSSGKFDYGFGEQQDVKCALNYLAARPEVLPNSIFIVGHSLGGAVSLYAIRDDLRVKGLVLWSTPKNHTYNVKKFIIRTRGKTGWYMFLFFAQLNRFFGVSKLFKLEVYGIPLSPKEVRQKLMQLDECKAITQLHMPTLTVVGETDNIVDIDEARQVFLSANEPKEFLIIKSADHVYKGKEEELVAKTVEWINKFTENKGG